MRLGSDKIDRLLVGADLFHRVCFNLGEENGWSLDCEGSRDQIDRFGINW